VIEILILSLIQGITEFLPISSSSHLIIASEYLKLEKNLSIDVSLHIGSFLAVLVYFYKDVLNFYENKVLFLKIIISSIPVMLIGIILFETNLIEKIRNIETIAWATLIFGILLFISDKCKIEKTITENFSLKSAIFIGLFQVLALIPGVSRSGIAITAARFLKFKRVDAAKISFLISIPILGAVSFLGLKNILFSESQYIARLNIFAIIFAFFFSIVTIKYFLKYLNKFSLNIFFYYRFLLGIILLIVAYL
jgi:undecaprenyl-diphosphatase